MPQLTSRQAAGYALSAQVPACVQRPSMLCRQECITVKHSWRAQAAAGLVH